MYDYFPLHRLVEVHMSNISTIGPMIPAVYIVKQTPLMHNHTSVPVVGTCASLSSGYSYNICSHCENIKYE